MRNVEDIEDEEDKLREQLREAQVTANKRLAELGAEKRRAITLVPATAGTCWVCAMPFSDTRGMIALSAPQQDRRGICVDCVEAAHGVALSLRLAGAGG